MRIRLVRDADYSKIARLRRQTIRTVNSSDYSEDIIQDWTAQTNAQTFRNNAHKHKRWVAVEKNRIIGFCDHNFACELSRVYVHKDHLRKGVGSRLLAVAEDSLRKFGCKEIRIESTITAKKFYEKNGYKVLKKTFYKTKNMRSTVYKMSKKIVASSGAKLVTVDAPEYTIDREPDYLKIGKKVDRAIERNFDDGSYVFRAIGKDDHPNLSLDALISIIGETGTDRYDPERKGVCHEEFSAYDHDIQASAFTIKNSKIVLDDSYEYPTLFGDTIHKFYRKTLHDRGYAVRIDILTIYDAAKLIPARKVDRDARGVMPRLERYLFKFKNKEGKKDALVGVIKIAR